MIRSLFPARSAATMAVAMARAVASSAASCVARVSAVSDRSKCVAIGSFEFWLKTHRQGCKFTSLVMIAPRQRKRARSMRDPDSGFGQDALCDRDHVGCGNVPHAAMVVHSADRAMAGLARHDGFGLERRREPVQRRSVIGACGV